MNGAFRLGAVAAALRVAGGGGGGDPNFSDVSLLMHFDGANGSTTFVDSSSNALTATAQGNAQLSTAQSRFGTASLLLDGAGDYVRIPAAAGGPLDFGSGNFTIEGWIRVTALTSSLSEDAVLGVASSGGSTTYSVRISTTSAQLFGSGTFGGTLRNAIAAGTVALNTWMHFAVVRNGGSLRSYLNGAGGTSVSVSGALQAPNSNLALGTLGDFATGTRDYHGFIDELRITKGVARYTADFTPPTAPFPDA